MRKAKKNIFCRQLNPLINSLYKWREELHEQPTENRWLETYYIQLKTLFSGVLKVRKDIEIGNIPIFEPSENPVMKKINRTHELFFTFESKDLHDDFIKMSFMYHLSQLLGEIKNEIVETEKSLF